jgi:hypothetical protein
MLAGATSAQTAINKYTPSLRLSCVDTPFLTVNVSAPDHDSFVNVELGLVDPKGRTAGADVANSIPRSRYGRIVEMPSHPEKSKVTAVEICGATPGKYVISVSEHGDFDYRLVVGGDDGTNSNHGNESQSVNLHSDGDRLCRFSFNFRMAKGEVAVQWLDKGGHPMSVGEFPGCDVIPRT